MEDLLYHSNLDKVEGLVANAYERLLDGVENPERAKETITRVKDEISDVLFELSHVHDCLKHNGYMRYKLVSINDFMEHCGGHLLTYTVDHHYTVYAFTNGCMVVGNKSIIGCYRLVDMKNQQQYINLAHLLAELCVW